MRKIVLSSFTSHQPEMASRLGTSRLSCLVPFICLLADTQYSNQVVYVVEVCCAMLPSKKLIFELKNF